MNKASLPFQPVKLAPYWSPLLTLAVFPLAALPVIAVVLADGFWIRLLAGLLGGCAFWSLDHLFRGALNANVDRVESARRALAEAASSDEPIALVLRSFRRTHGYRDVPASFSLFDLVEPALRETGFRPCALGVDLPLPANHGTCLIESSDADWRNRFDTLSASAAVILMAPETSASVIEEAAALRDRGLLDKTILLMAPNSIDMPGMGGSDVPNIGSGGNDGARRDRWQEVRISFRNATGIDLPVYCQEGALIEIDPDTRAAHATPLRRTPTDERATAILLRWNKKAYREDYGVPFGEIWREVCARKRFSGPPIRQIWSCLKVQPPRIDRWSYWRPPGDDGLFRRNIVFAAALGWAVPTGTLCLLWILTPLLEFLTPLLEL